LLNYDAMSGKHSRILVVDDDPDWLELMTELFEDEGYTVAVAKDGVRAAAMVPRFHPAVVVTDLQMPRMDGRQLLAALHAREPDVPVVVVTGDRSPARAKGLEAAFRIIEKPPSIEKLLAVVADAAAQ
jgi:two-component system, NtrC family, C4-dicarboxylate transport response regulator DctD